MHFNHYTRARRKPKPPAQTAYPTSYERAEFALQNLLHIRWILQYLETVLLIAAAAGGKSSSPFLSIFDFFCAILIKILIMMIGTLFSTKNLALATLVLQNTFLVVCMHYSRTISATRGSIGCSTSDNYYMKPLYFFVYRDVLLFYSCW